MFMTFPWTFWASCDRNVVRVSPHWVIWVGMMISIRSTSVHVPLTKVLGELCCQNRFLLFHVLRCFFWENRGWKGERCCDFILLQNFAEFPFEFAVPKNPKASPSLVTLAGATFPCPAFGSSSKAHAAPFARCGGNRATTTKAFDLDGYLTIRGF